MAGNMYVKRWKLENDLNRLRNYSDRTSKSSQLQILDIVGINTWLKVTDDYQLFSDMILLALPALP